jgi:hypothetical protein
MSEYQLMKSEVVRSRAHELGDYLCKSNCSREEGRSRVTSDALINKLSRTVYLGCWAREGCVRFAMVEGVIRREEERTSWAPVSYNVPSK